MVINSIKELREKWRQERANKAHIGPSDLSTYISDVYGEDRLKPPTIGRILKGFDINTERKRYIPIVGYYEGEVQRSVIVWGDEKLKALYKRYVPGEFVVTGVTNVTAMTESLSFERISNLCLWARGKREEGSSVTSVTTVMSVTGRLLEHLRVGPVSKPDLLKIFDGEELGHANNTLNLWMRDGKVFLNASGDWVLNPSGWVDKFW